MSTDYSIDQATLARMMVPLIRNNGQVYEKCTQVQARLAEAGEQIITVTRSGEETRNQAEPGDAVVRNLSGLNEQYLVSADTFPQRYRVDEPLDATWKTYVPLGKVLALEVTQSTADVIGLGDAFWFEAPWHDAQFCQVDDFLVIPLPDKGEVYRIGREEFLQTYQPLQDC